jgi:cholesterol transport system auxiliary component
VRTSRTRSGASLSVLALALCACVSVFPRSTPVQLYRFGYGDAPAGVGPASAGPVLGVIQTSFDAAAATDRILTVSGQSAAYIHGARWIAPAPVLFDEALARAFQTPGAPVIARRGETVAARYSLALDVQTFEARYDQGPEAPPEVVVQIRAVLIRNDTRQPVAERTLSSVQRASDNRIGPIVQAYDRATRDGLVQLVAWTGSEAR